MGPQPRRARHDEKTRGLRGQAPRADGDQEAERRPASPGRPRAHVQAAETPAESQVLACRHELGGFAQADPADLGGDGKAYDAGEGKAV